MEKLLADIKKSMRMNHANLDDEIQRLINACLLDLKRVGICSLNDSLTDQACVLYCKWHMDYEGKGEQYQRCYEELRDSLSMCQDYRKQGISNV